MSDQDNRRLAVLIGAGASYNCTSGINDVEQRLRPPVVNQLFENNAIFNEVLRQYPAAEALSGVIRSRLKKGMALEEILRQLSTSEDFVQRKQVWYVRLYLQHLFYLISDYYVRGGGTYFHTLVKLTQESSYNQVLYMTVNYDLFLDRALSSLYFVKFNDMGSYCQFENHGWMLAKLHGSVNWGQMISNSNPSGRNIVQLLDSFDADLNLSAEVALLPSQLPNTFHLPVMAEQNQQLVSVRTGGRSDVMYYPALSVPVAGKTDFFIPEAHLERVRSFLDDCTDFLIIGFSGKDLHVVDLFKRVNRVKKLSIVCGNQKSGLETFSVLRKASPVFAEFPKRDIVYKPWKPHGSGFTDFVDRGELENFFND